MNKLILLSLALLFISCASSQERLYDVELAEVTQCLQEQHCDKVLVGSYFRDIQSHCLLDALKSRKIVGVERMNSITLGNDIPVVYVQPVANCPRVTIGISLVTVNGRLSTARIEPVFD